MENLITTAGPALEKLGGPQRACQRGPELGAAHASSRLRSATDERVPRVSETDRGGRRDDDVARRRW